MPNLVHKRGTRAALNALATANGLVPWQIYALSDEQGRIAMATGVSTYQTFKLQNESSGGSAAINTAIVVVPQAEYYQAAVSISDAAALATSSILCSLAPTEDWEFDELDEFSVVGAPGNGVIDFVIRSAGPIVGTFKIQYLLG